MRRQLSEQYHRPNHSHPGSCTGCTWDQELWGLPINLRESGVVTPEQAEELLQPIPTENRPVSQESINKYTKQLKVLGTHRVQRMVSIPQAMDVYMRGHPEINWSMVARDAFQRVIDTLEEKSNAE